MPSAPVLARPHQPALRSMNSVSVSRPPIGSCGGSTSCVVTMSSGRTRGRSHVHPRLEPDPVLHPVATHRVVLVLHTHPIRRPGHRDHLLAASMRATDHRWQDAGMTTERDA